MLKNKEKILSTLKNLMDDLKTNYHVKKIGLFGSYLTNSQKETSDIDLLVEFDENADLFHLIGLSRYLEEIFGTKVDVVSKRAIKEDLKQNILKEVIYA
ncbi:MAG: nucleotidyltransferase [Promethearchaeota archaeon]|nr:MAG: nucleotidyltransferase [Candidatus Lokiarchaeota archaeon]